LKLSPNQNKELRPVSNSVCHVNSGVRLKPQTIENKGLKLRAFTDTDAKCSTDAFPTDSERLRPSQWLRIAWHAITGMSTAFFVREGRLDGLEAQTEG
jgi:hypothetical protein